MKQFIKKKLHESRTYDLIESLIDEDYPSSFNMEEFKSLPSFAARIRYCGEHLQRISSGSSRIVYRVDNDKVLKLAWNRKGLAQNEVEGGQGNDYYLDGTVANVYDMDPDNKWIEMALARKVNVAEFKRITGVDWKVFQIAIHNYGAETTGRGYKRSLPDGMMDEMWDNEFVSNIFDYIGNYGVPVGDLAKTSTYGIVKQDGEDSIVLIDYGLTSEVYDSYYS